MKLSKTWKIVIGILTAWVALYPFLMVLFMFPVFFFIAMQGSQSNVMPTGFFMFFFIFMAFMMLSSFLQMGMSIFYLALIIKNKTASDVLRIVLGIGSFFMPFIGMPISFFVFVWPESIPEWALDKSGETKN